MSQPQVQIYNPKSRNGHTKVKKAQADVDRGRARWRVNGAPKRPGYQPSAEAIAAKRVQVEYLDDVSDYRAAAVAASIAESEAMYDRDVRGARASLNAIEGLPVIGDVVKLFTPPRTRHSVRAPLPVRHIYQSENLEATR